MKKKLAVLAAVLMASAVLGGCAQKTPETETQTQTETQTETETETVATEAGRSSTRGIYRCRCPRRLHTVSG